ncbi:MAG: hypothetical protein HQK71_01890 [Desulfamplus sp.]|nr:hypothetical protein [Desulfamplus sp.]
MQYLKRLLIWHPHFSEEEQEILGKYWIHEMQKANLIETIKDEIKWQKSFVESQDILEMLADKALEEYREGKAEKRGWDEL